MKNTTITIFKNLLTDFKYYQDYFLFLLVVLAGGLTKIYIAIQKGKKPTFNWFIAELLMSGFVAFSVYAVFDQFLHFNKMFTYMVCAWGGSMSTLLHAKVEEIITSVADNIKNLLTKKIEE